MIPPPCEKTSDFQWLKKSGAKLGGFGVWRFDRRHSYSNHRRGNSGIASTLTTDQEGADNGSYHYVFANAFRSNRNVQCLGMGIPYAEVQMNVGFPFTPVLNISVENTANASTLASFTVLTGSLAYVIGGSGTSDAVYVYVDNAVAELTIGGGANMVSGFGWSLAFQRNIGISASVVPLTTLQLRSELDTAQ